MSCYILCIVYLLFVYIMIQVGASRLAKSGVSKNTLFQQQARHHRCNGRAPLFGRVFAKGAVAASRCSLGIAVRLSWKRFAKNSDYKLE